VETAATARDEAAQVGSTASAAASDVTGTVKEQAGAVAGEAVTQVRDLLDQTRSQLSEQAGGAQQKLGESVRGLSEELRSMVDGSGSGSGPAAEFARSLADRGRTVADYLGSKEPGELVQELRLLAARRPGGFLLGALAAGVVAGRLVRGASAAPSDGTGGAGGARGARDAHPATTTGTSPAVTAPPLTAPATASPVAAALPPMVPAPHAFPDVPVYDTDTLPTVPPHTPGSGL